MSHPPQKNLRKQNSQKKVADSQEVTPLFAATTSGHEEIVQYLVIQSQNCKFKKRNQIWKHLHLMLAKKTQAAH